MYKILFLINSLGGGGAERALANLVQYIDKSKYEVTVKTLYDTGIYKETVKKYANYSSAKLPVISGMNYIFKLFPAKILHRMFVREKYNLEIAFLEGITTKIVSGADDGIKKAAWVRIDVSKYKKNERCYISRKNVIKSYNKMNAIAFVGTDALESFQREYGIRQNLFVVRNIFDYQDMIEKSKEKCSVHYKYLPVFGTVGRLTDQKGYDRLLEVHIRLMKEGLRHSIIILGDGSLKKKLESEIREAGVENSFILAGFQDNPFKYFKTFDWFVSSSNYEGFASVLREAVLLGTPVISTDCSGAKEILGNNDYGIVVENSIEGLYYGMKMILENGELKNEYKRKVIKRQEFFCFDKTVKENIEFISSLGK